MLRSSVHSRVSPSPVSFGSPSLARSSASMSTSPGRIDRQKPARKIDPPAPPPVNGTIAQPVPVRRRSPARRRRRSSNAFTARTSLRRARHQPRRQIGVIELVFVLGDRQLVLRARRRSPAPSGPPPRFRSVTPSPGDQGVLGLADRCRSGTAGFSLRPIPGRRRQRLPVPVKQLDPGLPRMPLRPATAPDTHPVATAAPFRVPTMTTAPQSRPPVMFGGEAFFLLPRRRHRHAASSAGASSAGGRFFRGASSAGASSATASSAGASSAGAASAAAPPRLLLRFLAFLAPSCAPESSCPAGFFLVFRGFRRAGARSAADRGNVRRGRSAWRRQSQCLARSAFSTTRSGCSLGSIGL